MTQEEGMLHYEAGQYELHGYPLRPGDVIEVFTGSGWIPGYIAYERGWYWVAPGGSMVRVGEEMQARFQRQDLREGWESEDGYDSELLLERWSHGELFDEDSIPPRACNGLVILARDGRGKITARVLGTRTTNKLQGALTTAREVLQTTPTAVRIEVHLFEGYESPYRGKPLAVFSLADRADEGGGDEEEEEL
jgi:Domain of unknown function (DUF5348)